MNYLVYKYSDPEALVMVTFAGTISTGNALLPIEKHQQFVACNLNESCAEAAMKGLIFVFSRQVVNDKSYINFEFCVEETAKKDIKKIYRLKKKRKLSCWSVPKVSTPFRTLLRHILLWLSS